MIEYNKRRNKDCRKAKKEEILFLLAFFIFAILSITVIAQPTPHNIDGQVFTDNSKSDGVPGGLTVKINDTFTGDTIITYTEDPGPPPLRGIYSATIVGNNDDIVIVTAWNSTHYGIANATLLPTTTTIDVVFNLTRPSETNVTITLPANNSIKDTTTAFRVTANIDVIGANGVNCNATIFFSNNRNNNR